MDMNSLHGKLSSLGKNEIILDVRGRDEFAEGHVEGAINIPHDEVGSHVAELAKYSCVYMHCRSGKRAQVALATLEQKGLKNIVCISDGGMLNWVEAGYKTVR